jgi:hypothetical protein
LLNDEESGEKQPRHQHQVFGGIAEEHFESETDHAGKKTRAGDSSVLEERIPARSTGATRDISFRNFRVRVFETGVVGPKIFLRKLIERSLA